MNQNDWVPLLEFAIKEGISPSTVRRKIKSGKVVFRLQDGKYLIQAGIPETKPNFQETTPHISDVLRYAEESLKTVKEAHREILNQKEIEVTKLKSENLVLAQEVQELRMLIEILEKRNTK